MGVRTVPRFRSLVGGVVAAVAALALVLTLAVLPGSAFADGCTVTYNTIGDNQYNRPADEVVPAPVTGIAPGTELELAAPLTSAVTKVYGKTGGRLGTWSFTGWYMDASCTGEVMTSLTVTEDVTVYGKWLFTVGPEPGVFVGEATLNPALGGEDGAEPEDEPEVESRDLEMNPDPKVVIAVAVAIAVLLTVLLAVLLIRKRNNGK